MTSQLIQMCTSTLAPDQTCCESHTIVRDHCALDDASGYLQHHEQHPGSDLRYRRIDDIPLSVLSELTKSKSMELIFAGVTYGFLLALS